VDYHEEGQVVIFALVDACEGECYKLLDGRYVMVLRGTLKDVEENLSGTRVSQYFLAVERSGVPKVRRAEITCDYCGGEIRGGPMTVRMGRKVYYACCKTVTFLRNYWLFLITSKYRFN
jgi:hypothetical protein